ncbi:T9SS type A sorting domain-containing protein, partial [candidate division WOR-3 bacterium]|nr:T9SS type A sorting domain-containing protein [candidate division WOR-3 bacterium]
PHGDTLWSRLYSFARLVALSGVTLDVAGNMLLTGTVVDSVSGQERWSCLVMMCDSLGDPAWTWRYSYGSYAAGCGLAPDSSGSVYVFGSVEDTDDDYLLVKLRYESGIEERAAALGPARPRSCVGSSLVRRGSPLRLRVPVSGRYEVALFDALGQKTGLVRSGQTGQGESDSHLGQIPCGVYVLRVTTPGRTESQRLVVVE